MPFIPKSKITNNIRSFKQRLAILVIALVTSTAALLINTTGLANAACATTPNPALGTDTQSISVPNSGTYYVWSRILAPDTTNNSYFLQIDGGAAIDVGHSTSIPANTWTWVNYQCGSTSSVSSVNLSAGSHQVLMTGEQPGVGIDEVLFLSDPSCIPTGTGTNCTTTTTSPTVSISSPATGATVSGSTTLSASASESGGTISNVQFKLDGTNLGSPITTSPYNYTWNTAGVANGSHTLTAVATDSNNNSTTSSGVSVNVSNTVTDAAPTAPTNLATTSVGTNNIGLKWGASTDTDSTPLAGYRVWRGDANYANWVQIGSVSPSTLSYNDTFVVPGTSYTYGIRAYDTAGNTSAGSNTIKVTTNTATPPTVSLTAPSSGSTVSGTTTVSASASDPVSVSSVQFKLDGNLLGSSLTTAPYSLSWDTTKVANGTHTLTALATDPAGLTTTSTPVSVTVNNTVVDTTPPSQPTGLSANAVSSSQINLSWTASTDNVGVTGYNVYRSSNGSNPSLIATVSSPSYGNTGLSASTSYSYYIVAFDAAGNKSTASTTVSAATQATSNTVTVQGVVTSSTTGSPLIGAYVHTGNQGTKTGAATSYTNTLGQYLLLNITPNRKHDYNYSDTGYKSRGFAWYFTTGTFTENVSLVP